MAYVAKDLKIKAVINAVLLPSTRFVSVDIMLGF